MYFLDQTTETAMVAFFFFLTRDEYVNILGSICLFAIKGLCFQFDTT